jgi:ribonuclease P protein component
MVDQRLRRRERVLDSADFRRAFERRRAVSDAWLVVHGRLNGLDHARLGVTVPRKVARRAVARNRIKRLVREAFRRQKDRFAPGVDLIVVPRSAEMTAEQARASLAALGPDAARRAGAS